MIALGLEGPAGESSFVDSALTAAEDLRSAGGDIEILVRPSIAAPPPAHWNAVLAHGSALTQWAHSMAGHGLPTVLTDLPAEPRPSVHYVDWAWDEGMAEIARRILGSGGRIAALLAGPAFPPQQRIVAAVRTVGAEAGAEPVAVVHARTFADLTEADELVAHLLQRSEPGDHVLSSAGPLGERVCRSLREHGRVTHGIARTPGGHHWRVASDVRQAVGRLLLALHRGQSLPAVTHCGLDSGLMTVEGPDSEAS